jgi:hypothetical protein
MSYSQVYITSEIDNRLVGNPQVTYFKSVYRRHTGFYKGLHAYETTEYIYPNINKKNEDISHGTFDLITNIFIEHKITNISSTEKIWANLGNTIINNIIFKVGSTELYKVDGLYMEARAELDHPFVPSLLSGSSSSSVPPIMTIRGVGDNILVCNTGSQYNITTMAGGVSGSKTGSSEYNTDTFYTYPNFYFCNDYSSSFPVCALNNSDTTLEINYRPWSEFTNNISTTGTLSSTVNIEFVNLSDDERMRFINNTEPYIYYRIEDINIGIGNDKKNSPIRQLFFVGENTAAATQILTKSTPISLSASPISLTGIDFKINGESLYENPDTNIGIFTKQNIYRNFMGYGRDLASAGPKGYLDSIGVHCFCLDQTNTPSGHLSSNTNFSINFTPSSVTDIKIYAEVIKFFHIMGGQLSLLYV